MGTPFERLTSYFSNSHGKPRVDDRRVLSGIIFANRNGLRWRDTPKEYEPYKTLYNRWKRWGGMGVFGRLIEGLLAESTDPKPIIIDATYLKAHRMASSLRLKGEPGRLIAHTKGGRNTRLHALTDTNGRSLSFFITAGQINDYAVAAALLDDLLKAQWMLADRGYDADGFRDALQQKSIKPCFPGRKSRSLPVKYSKRRYTRRNRIETMFGRLVDWRRIATRYDRCPTVFFSALALAVTVIFWL